MEQQCPVDVGNEGQKEKKTNKMTGAKQHVCDNSANKSFPVRGPIPCPISFFSLQVVRSSRSTIHFSFIFHWASLNLFVSTCRTVHVSMLGVFFPSCSFIEPHPSHHVSNRSSERKEQVVHLYCCVIGSRQRNKKPKQNNNQKKKKKHKTSRTMKGRSKWEGLL